MRKFIGSSSIYSLCNANFLEECSESLPFFSKLDETANVQDTQNLMNLRNGSNVTLSCLLQDTTEKPLSGAKICYPSKDDITIVEAMLLSFQDDPGVVIRLSTFVESFLRVRLENDIISCSSYRGGECPGSRILARYLGPNIDIDSKLIRPAIVQRLYRFHVTLNNISTSEIIEKCIYFAKVDWYEEHPNKDFYGQSCPLKIWCTTFERYSNASIIPLKLVSSRFAAVKEEVKFGTIPGTSFPESDTINIVFELPTNSFS